MKNRARLLLPLFITIIVTGCAGSTAPTDVSTTLTPGERNRLAELTTLHEAAQAHADSAMTAEEYQELTRLRDKAGLNEEPEPQGSPYVLVGIVGVTVAALFIAMIVSLSNMTYNF